MESSNSEGIQGTTFFQGFQLAIYGSFSCTLLSWQANCINKNLVSVFVEYFFFHLFIFSLCMPLKMERFSCRQYIVGSFLFIHSANLYFLIGEFNQFPFKLLKKVCASNLQQYSCCYYWLWPLFKRPKKTTIGLKCRDFKIFLSSFFFCLLLI